MSPEIAGVLIALASLILAAIAAMFGLLGYSLRRIDARFDKVDKRFERIDARFERIDARFDRIDERFDKIEGDIVTLQISVARLEGPPRGLALR